MAKPWFHLIRILEKLIKWFQELDKTVDILLVFFPQWRLIKTKSKGNSSQKPSTGSKSCACLKDKTCRHWKETRSHFSFTFDTRRTFFPSAASSQRTCPPTYPSLALSVSLCFKNAHPDFGLITHQKRLVHFNALFGNATVSFIALEDISSLQSCCMKPQNIVEI